MNIPSSTASFKVLLVGGSRHIGYLTGLRLLEHGHTVTYLLRNPTCFNKDAKMQSYITSGRARIVKGDILVARDARQAWEEAGKGGDHEGHVDFVLSSVGTLPKFSMARGIHMEAHDICARGIQVLLTAMPDHLRIPGSQPRIIAISTTGLGAAGHAALPNLHRIAYPLLIDAPHRDKLGMEIVLSHVSGHMDDWVSSSEVVPERNLPAGWASAPGFPAAGSLKEMVVIRPAWLVDNPVTGKYRVIVGHGDRKCKTIAREDVAHFIVEQLVPQWEQWSGKAVALGY